MSAASSSVGVFCSPPFCSWKLGWLSWSISRTGCGLVCNAPMNYRGIIRLLRIAVLWKPAFGGLLMMDLSCLAGRGQGRICNLQRGLCECRRASACAITFGHRRNKLPPKKYFWSIYGVLRCLRTTYVESSPFTNSSIICSSSLLYRLTTSMGLSINSSEIRRAVSIFFTFGLT